MEIIMTFTKISPLVIGTLFASAVAATAATDTIESPTGFFVPDAANTFDSPYYRGASSDWGWTHGAIAGGFTSATLNIGAWDVDFSSGELDEIFAYDDGVAVSLGFLGGSNNDFAFTEFVLGANFFNDIEAGLQVFMDIDTANQGWLVTLSKSVLATDGSNVGNPNPGAQVPLPASALLLVGGLGSLAASRRLRKKS